MCWARTLLIGYLQRCLEILCARTSSILKSMRKNPAKNWTAQKASEMMAVCWRRKGATQTTPQMTSQCLLPPPPPPLRLHLPLRRPLRRHRLHPVQVVAMDLRQGNPRASSRRRDWFWRPFSRNEKEMLVCYFTTGTSFWRRSMQWQLSTTVVVDT